MSSSDLAPVRLTCHAQDESTRIEVLDGNLNPVPGSSKLGETSVELQPGAYAVRFQIGNDYVQRVAILAPDSGETHLWLSDADAPRFATSAPVRHTRSTREYHRGPARDLSLSPPIAKGAAGGNKPADSHLMLFARDLLEGRSSNAAQGLTLHSMQGELLADFGAEGQHDIAERWSGAHLALAAGPYRLRMTHDNRRFSEQMLYLAKGWQTQVFLSAGGGADPERRVQLDTASVLMARAHQGFDPERPDLRWTESALRALRDKGNIPGAVRTEMLWEKFENPMLGLYAGLLHLRRREVDPVLLRQVFDNLRALVGPLPDVLALGWGLALRHPATHDDALFMQGLMRPGDLESPPMLRASWELLVEASMEQPKLVPAGSFAERASQRLAAAGPWFSWRGEPPPARALPAEEDQVPELPGVLGKLIPRALYKTLVPGVAAVGLDVALPALAKVLSSHPEAGHLLASRRYTDTERRIAQYADPLVDPQLRALVQGHKAMEADLLEGLKSRTTSGFDLVRALQIPAGVALAAVWSLVRKLVLQPVVPRKQMLELFARDESQHHKALEQALLQAGRKPSPLHHRRGGEPAPDLALVFLRYRGSPAQGDQATAADAARTVQTLADNDYAIGAEGRCPTVADLDEAVARVRMQLIDALAREQAANRLRLPDGWQAQVLPAPEGAAQGALLPKPLD